MVDAKPQVVENIEKQQDVQAALAATTGSAPHVTLPATPRDRTVLVASALALMVAVSLRFALRVPAVAEALGGHAGLAERFVQALMLGSLTLLLTRMVEVYFIGRLRDAASRFDLRRVVRLVAGLGLAVILLSATFADWTTAAVSLGILSLILGFALQTPITSFIGWIYVLARRPYRVGDRIKIASVTGDVIDVSYLDTTLWEFGGDYLTSDHPSGRVIKFPNSIVLQEPVFNYSWPLFPYIWNEITFQVAYETDFELMARIMFEVVDADMGQAMQERVSAYRQVLARTPVDSLEVRERPAVFFRPDSVTWMQATVRYLVHPREAGRVKTRLVAKLLEALRQHPDGILFPKSSAR